VASVELMEEDADSAVPEACRTCVRLLERVIEQQAALFEPPHRLESASWVSARLVEVLPLPLPAKQELLELSDAIVRLERLNALIGRP
jgi:Lon protease-like protein